MDKGFFIVVVRRKGINTSVDFKNLKHWQADLIQPLRGWLKSSAETIEAVIDHQKEQYKTRAAAKEPVPELVDVNAGPMASGQTVRFVPIT